MRRFPPLNSLRAFEAAARHLSFTRAAEELNVTPGAVSQQVKTLEDYLDVRLFRRRNRALLLTDPAQVCLPLLSGGFDQLAAAVDSIRRERADKPLTVTVPPTMGARWLVPRLSDFHKKYPEVDIRIDASSALADLVGGDIDIGIRFGSGDYPGIDSTSLFPLQVYPVCSPDWLAEAALKTPRDLAPHMLLHADYPWDDAAWPDWQTWLHTVGIDNIDTAHGLRFSSPEMVIQAAIEGQGVALFGSVLVQDDLRSRRLVRPFEEAVPMDYSYYVVHARAGAERARVKVFKEWLLAQADAGEAA